MGDNSLDIEIFALKRPDGLLQLPQVQLPSTSTKSTWSCEYCFAPNEDKLGKCACCNSARTGSNNRASKRIQSPTASSIAASILNFNK